MTLIVLILIALLLLTFCLLGLTVLIAAFTTGVPFVPTKKKVIDAMLALSKPQPQETIYDLGSGNGEVLFHFPSSCKRIGYEKTTLLHIWAIVRNKLKKESVIFHKKDLFHQRYENADIITCYLFPHLMKRFEEEVWPQLPKRCRVVSHAFSFPNIAPQKEVQVGNAKVFLYVKK